MSSLISIQTLRAAAAWLVVYGHFVQFFSPHYLKDYDLGYFGVEIFFVISGFIMFYSLTSKQYGAKEFFFKRLIRIVPAYWFYTLLAVLLSWIYAEEFWFTGWNFGTLMASLFFTLTENPSGQGYYPLLTVGWTLSFEMFFYALLTLCIFIFGRFKFLICAIALIVLPLIWDEHWIDAAFGLQKKTHELPVAAVLSSKLLYEFVFGIVLGYGYLKTKSVKPYLLYVIGVALFFLVVLYFLTDIKKLENGMLDSRGSLSACLLVGSALCFESALSKIRVNVFSLLRYLGDISYSTYLLHTLVIAVFTHYVEMPGSAYGEFLLLLTLSLVILAISHLSYQHIEVGSFSKMLNKGISR